MSNVQRASGILLHVSSLPSDFGIGDLGPESYHFVDLLSLANQHYWSILPLMPTSEEYGNSPYQPTSAFAGNTLLISPVQLFKDGLLSEENLKELRVPTGKVEFKLVTVKKGLMEKRARLNFLENPQNSFLEKSSFEEFCFINQNWLDDYALFKALRDSTRQSWNNWSSSISRRDPQVLLSLKNKLSKQIEQEKFAQFIFNSQWRRLKNYCKINKVQIVGDIPFYVSYDSVDVWVNPELFKLDSDKKPLFVGGVPPDYFSSSGQRWGNPVYNWREMKNTAFQWWIERFRLGLDKCDLLRLDHFRGYIAYWQIPNISKTAKKGRWIRVPSKSFFKKIERAFPTMPFIAEDLGTVTENVRANVKSLDLLGMRVLIFGFDKIGTNPNFPSHIPKDSVAYTATHDTNTVKGWFMEEASPKVKEHVFKCLGRIVSENEVSIEFVKLAFESKANLCITPLQDLLNLGSEARMNDPASQIHNWEWRIEKEKLCRENFEKLAKITCFFDRCPF